MLSLFNFLLFLLNSSSELTILLTQVLDLLSKHAQLGSEVLTILLHDVCGGS